MQHESKLRRHARPTHTVDRHDGDSLETGEDDLQDQVGNHGMRRFIEAPQQRLKPSVGAIKVRALTRKNPDLVEAVKEAEEEEEQEEQDDGEKTMTNVHAVLTPPKLEAEVEVEAKEVAEVQEEEEEEEEEAEETDDESKTMTNLAPVVAPKVEEERAPIVHEEVEAKQQYGNIDFDETEEEEASNELEDYAARALTGLRKLRTRLESAYADHPNLWGAKTALIALEHERDDALEQGDPNASFGNVDQALLRMATLAARVSDEKLDELVQELLQTGKVKRGDVKTVNADITSRGMAAMERGDLKAAQKIFKEMDRGASDRFTYQRDRTALQAQLDDLQKLPGASAVASMLDMVQDQLRSIDSTASAETTEGYQSANSTITWLAPMIDRLFELAVTASQG